MEKIDKGKSNGSVQIHEVVKSLDGTSAKFTQITKEGFASIETGRYEVDGESIVCLSSQIGCGMRCAICKSTLPYEYLPGIFKRMVRNLTFHEIADQAINALEAVPPVSESVGIVFSYMGMGEPFANISEVKESIRFLGNAYPRNSRATLSTIGYNLQAVDDLADEICEGQFPIKVKLHFSLHASEEANVFEQLVRSYGVETCRFFSRGSDIEAGCGQLIKGILKD